MKKHSRVNRHGWDREEWGGSKTQTRIRRVDGAIRKEGKEVRSQKVRSLRGRGTGGSDVMGIMKQTEETVATFDGITEKVLVKKGSCRRKGGKSWETGGKRPVTGRK